MTAIWRSGALAGAAALALALVGSTPARAQTPPAPSPNPWANYATNRAAPWEAYAARPSAWSNYVYRGTASSGGLSSASGRNLAPRHLAYGFHYNPATSHWEHPGYGGKIPNYAHAGRPMQMPRPWVFWGAQNL